MPPYLWALGGVRTHQLRYVISNTSTGCLNGTYNFTTISSSVYWRNREEGKVIELENTTDVEEEEEDEEDDDVAKPEQVRISFVVRG